MPRRLGLPNRDDGRSHLQHRVIGPPEVLSLGQSRNRKPAFAGGPGQVRPDSVEKSASHAI